MQLVRALPPQALVGAIVDGGEAERLTPSLMADHERVAALLEQVEARQGGTDLAGALRLASKLLGGGPGEVMIFTDEAGPHAVPQATDAMAQLLRQGASLIPRRFTVRRTGERRAAPRDLRRRSGGRARSRSRSRTTGRSISRSRAPCGSRAARRSTRSSRCRPAASARSRSRSRASPRAGSRSSRCRTRHSKRTTSSRSTCRPSARSACSWSTAIRDRRQSRRRCTSSSARSRPGASHASRSGVLPDVTAASGIPALDPDVHRVVFLANVADPAPFAADLVAFVRKGGGLVLSMGNNVTAERYNGALQALLPAPLRKPRALAAAGRDSEPTALPDVTRPLFEPFARGGRAGFARIRWNQIYTLEPYADGGDVSTLLSLESGLPLLVERQVERGKVLLLLGTVDLAWGDLPLQARVHAARPADRALPRRRSVGLGRATRRGRRLHGCRADPRSVARRVRDRTARRRRVPRRGHRRRVPPRSRGRLRRRDAGGAAARVRRRQRPRRGVGRATGPRDRRDRGGGRSGTVHDPACARAVAACGARSRSPWGRRRSLAGRRADVRWTRRSVLAAIAACASRPGVGVRSGEQARRRSAAHRLA